MNSLILKFAFIGLAFINIQCSQPSTKVQVLEVQVFKEKMSKLGENAVLLDVRTADEVEQGKINGALHIDFYQDGFESKVNSLDKNGAYFIYCGSGVRSNKTANLMVKNGFTQVYDLKGGIGAWKQAGEPIN